jgi:hypothetical protein
VKASGTRAPGAGFEVEAMLGGFVCSGPISILGPISVLKLKFSPKGYPRKLVAELWRYPDNSMILGLST